MKIRRICETCNFVKACPYRTVNDCIDVQTSDYGYEEAMDKAWKFIEENLLEYTGLDSSAVKEEYDKIMEDY